MKWLIDEMLPPVTAIELERRGHDARSVSDAGLRGSPDSEVFELAVIESRFVVTENFADFAALVEARQRRNAPCVPVVFARTSMFLSGRALAARLARHLDEWAKANPEPYEGLHWP